MAKEESIGALWVKDGKNDKFMTGQIKIDGVVTRVIVFKNKYKETTKHPDYKIYLAKERTQVTDDDSPF